MKISINYKILWSIGILLGSISISHAQNKSVSLGNIFIPAKGNVAIFSDHNFQEIGNGLLPGIVATDRSENNGKIVFSQNSGWINADNYSHVDGFVGSMKDSPFLLPTGDNGIYAPVGVSNGLNVEAAYYAVDPSFAVTSVVLSDEYTDMPEDGPFDIQSIVSNVESVSDQEYWKVKGSANTKITLTWNEVSNLEELVESNLEDLTIVGWNGAEWVDIPSSLDEKMINIKISSLALSNKRSNFTTGSITTDEEMIPDTYSVITLGKLRFDKNLDHNSLILYPNPVSAGSYLNVRYQLAKSDKGELKLFDSSNQLVHFEKLDGLKNKIKIPLNKYGRGVFSVAITSDNGTTVYKKLIVVDL
ncbi:MAG: T9SS type A sorting domain-containing protein [Saprospiraceae bacterium]|nr:T9SS type A sorting domain-containing protein [Saprospiraceae bacterium]|tara:strand:+ start:1324 stop:2403 length:1080 start_codon:yes stop_codon:yes gene_type:complete